MEGATAMRWCQKVQWQWKHNCDGRRNGGSDGDSIGGWCDGDSNGRRNNDATATVAIDGATATAMDGMPEMQGQRQRQWTVGRPLNGDDGDGQLRQYAGNDEDWDVVGDEDDNNNGRASESF